MDADVRFGDTTGDTSKTARADCGRNMRRGGICGRRPGHPGRCRSVEAYTAQLAARKSEREQERFPGRPCCAELGHRCPQHKAWQDICYQTAGRTYSRRDKLSTIEGESLLGQGFGIVIKGPRKVAA